MSAADISDEEDSDANDNDDNEETDDFYQYSSATKLEARGPSSKERQDLEEAVQMIQQNPAASQNASFKILDDDSASVLRSALMVGNDRMKRINLTIGGLFTDLGAKLIMEGLEASKVRDLTIWLNEEGLSQWKPRSAVLSFILASIPLMQKLSIKMKLSDKEACEIGAKLDGNTNLLELDLKIRLGMSHVTAVRLGTGIHHSRLQKLQLNALEQGDELRSTLQTLFSRAVASVQVLQLNFRLEDDDATVLGEALVTNTTLRSLSLKFNHNELSAPAATHLARGIQLSRIVHLDLDATQYGGISPEVEDILYDGGVRRSPTIRELSIGRGMQATGSLASCLPQLERLTLGGARTNVSNVTVHLRNATQLLVLHLAPFLNSHHMALLCEALPHLPLLAKLSIAGCLTCQEGESLVENNREHAASVTYDELEQMSIEAVAAERLMVAVTNHPSLVDLDLTGSVDVGYMGLYVIGTHLENTKLHRLVLGDYHDAVFDVDHDNDDLDGDLQKLQLSRTAAKQALVHGVRSNVHLHVLEYDFFMEPASRIEIDFYLDLNRAGRLLLQSDHVMPPAVWGLILAKCGESAGAMYYFLREQPQLVVSASSSVVGESSGQAKRPRLS